MVQFYGENVRVELRLEKETIATQDEPMNADVLTTRVVDGIAVVRTGDYLAIALHRGRERECES
jgi:hypothetical protein